MGGSVERYPQQRHLSGEQAPGEFIKAGNALGELARRAEQPVNDVIDRVVTRALLGRRQDPKGTIGLVSP